MCGTMIYVAQNGWNGEDVRVSGVGADERPRAGGLACAKVEPADVVERERELVL